MQKTFGMFGLAGYVAPRHLQAIKDNDGTLIAACDPHDSVGIIDSFFPECEFFTQEDEFKEFCEISKPDYIVICSPNYLHKQQSQFGLTIGANVICEKPVVLDPRDLSDLVDFELRFNKRVNSILQLRLKPELQDLRRELGKTKKQHEVKIDYITPRGRWYFKTWKADDAKSGSLVTNIGIHLFDLMIWMFGSVEDIKLHCKTDTQVKGDLYLTRARVAFNLSISGTEPKRKISIGNREIEFSKGFTQLHTYSYKEILNGRGFGIVEAAPSVILCDKIRKIEVI